MKRSAPVCGVTGHGQENTDTDIATHFEKQTAPPQPLAWLTAMRHHARAWVLLAILAGFSGGLLLILQAFLLARVIHGAFIDGLSRAALGPLLYGLLATVVVRAGLAWVREVSGFRAGARIRQEIRMLLVHHVGALGPLQETPFHSGGLSTVILEQVEALQAFYAFYLPQLALAIAIPVAILTFVFPVSWAAGGLLLLTAPLIPLFMVLIGMGAESISQRNFQALSRLSAHFLDVLQGLPTLKLLNRSRGEEAAIARVSDDYRRNTMKVLRVAFLSTAVLELVSSFAIALVAVYLGATYLGYADFGLYGQRLTLKHGLFILLLAPDFYLPLRELGTHYHARAEALGAAESILQILSTKPMTTFTGRQRVPARVPAGIEFRRVSFAYDENQNPVLHNTGFHIAPGERVAFVGASGSGKTTILNLMLGLIQPGQGEICVGGTPLSDLDLETWRRSLAWLGQDPSLFKGSIAANICLGQPQVGPAEIEAAAHRAHVQDFAQRLPHGLQTPIGEQGWGLSRGQAQRIALARVFLKKAPVLLLDEPTAGLDVDTARKIMQSLLSFSEKRTLIMLTHRREQLDRFETIYRLENGSIVPSNEP